MFETIRPLTPEQITEAAKSLNNGGGAMCLIDPSGVYLAIVPTPGKPFEVDFRCVRRTGADSWESVGLSIPQYNIITAWMGRAWPAIAKRWRELAEVKP